MKFSFVPLKLIDKGHFVGQLDHCEMSLLRDAE